MKAPEALLRPTAHLSAPRARGRNLTAGPSIINGIGDLLTNIGEFEIFIFGQRLLGRESEFAIFDCFFSQIIRVVHGTPPISERSYRKFSRVGAARLSSGVNVFAHCCRLLLHLLQSMFDNVSDRYNPYFSPLVDHRDMTEFSI